MHWRPLAATAAPGALLLLAAAACVGDDPELRPSEDPSDAAPSDGGQPSDGSSDPDQRAQKPPCDRQKPFAAPTPAPFVRINTSNHEANAWLLPDELTVYFARATATGAIDIYRATRANLADAFDLAAPLVGKVNEPDPAVEGGPIVTQDDLTMFLSKKSSETQAYDVWSSTRANTNAEWPKAEPVALMNTAADEGPNFLWNGELWMTRLGVGIMRAPKSGNSFGPPVTAGLGAKSQAPVLTPDGKRIYYTLGASPGLDVVTATRTQVGDTFSAPTPLPALNSPEDDYATWLSPDDCRLYLHSSRPGQGGTDLYVAERPAAP
jgi:WD40 repeat protein